MKLCVRDLAKNRIHHHTGYLAGFLFLLVIMISGQKACAAVTEGEPGKTYSGKYVVIVNTSEPEGTMLADSSLSTLEQSTVGQAAGSGLTVYETGSRRVFYTYSGYKTFTCIGAGEHCYIWMEDGLKAAYDTAGKTSTIAADMAQTYEKGAYETLNELSGGAIPCRDGSRKLSIVLEQISGASGVYMGKGNEPDITAIHINTPNPGTYVQGGMRTMNGLLVHEGQHALFEQLTSYDYRQNYMGINEAFSVAAMEYAWGNGVSSNWLDYIAGNNAIRNGSSVLYQTYRNQTAQDYSLPYLFVRYLINRKCSGYDPVSFFRAAYQVQASYKSAGTYLQAVMGNNVRFADLITDFYTAIAANEATGKYGFEGDAVVQSALNHYPYYEGDDATLPEPTGGMILQLGENETFTVPTDSGENIHYRIVREKNNTFHLAAGKGTADDPYQITSVKDWNLIAAQPGAHYKLMRDLNFTGHSFITIGTFSGELDGNGHMLSGISHALCAVNQGTIRNLTVNAAMTGIANNSYGIVVQNNRGTIDHCMVIGSIKAILYGQYTMVGTHTGAIAGENEEAGIIQYCTVMADMELEASALQSRNGGIAGENRGIIANSCFKGRLTVNQSEKDAVVCAGGIAGETGVNGGIGGSIKQCLNAGEITVNGGTAQAGQICGTKKRAYLANCYGKKNGLSLFGSDTEDAKQTTSKKLTDEEWTKSDSFEGLDFQTGWQMGNNGPEMSGSENLIRLEITDQPAFCYVGEVLTDVNGQLGYLLVNEQTKVKITNDMVTETDNAVAGYRQIVVKYMGKTLSYMIQVKKPVTVNSLRVLRNPQKIKYEEGQSFDPTGVQLMASVDGESQERQIGAGFSWKQTALKVTDTSVWINYYGKAVEVPVVVAGKASSGEAAGREPENSGAGSGNIGENTGDSQKEPLPGNTEQVLPAAVVKLNASSLPLQVKKSTTALKIKERSAGDTVVSWSSSNKKVAVVNAKTGKITAKKKGTTTITVTMRSKAQAKCLIKVQKGKVKTKKLHVGKTSITLKKGDKYRIRWEKQPLTSGDKVTFQSSAKKIARVSGKGVITAKKKGITYITVKSGAKKRKIKVIVQ